MTFSSVYRLAPFLSTVVRLAHHTELVEVEGIEVSVKIFANYLCPIVRKGLCVNAIIFGCDNFGTKRTVTS
jgi:hypothetical protein